MPSYHKVPRTRPRYYVDESAMVKGVSEYMAPTTPSESKQQGFAFRPATSARRDSDASQADSDRASSHGGVSP